MLEPSDKPVIKGKKPAAKGKISIDKLTEILTDLGVKGDFM